MSVPNRAPRSLRLAVATWSRRDRCDHGEVVLATAQDLIDEGASTRREALGIVRTGIVLRGRGLGRDLRLAPWEQAGRLFATACALLAAGLVSAARGGPEGLVHDVLFVAGLEQRGVVGMTLTPSPADAAGLLLLAALVVVALAVATRRRAVGLASAIGAGMMLSVMYARGYAPRSSGVEFQRASSPASGASSNWLGMSIDTSGVIGWLLALTAFTIAVSLLHARLMRRAAGERESDSRGSNGTRAIRATAAHDASASSGSRSAAPIDDASPDNVGRWRARGSASHFAVATLVAVVALPLVGAILDRIAHRSVAQDASFGNPYAAPVWTILVAAVVVFVSAVATRRRSPAVAHSAALLTMALWVPVVWMITGLLNGWIPLEASLGETAAILVLWAVVGAVGVATGTALIAAAGRRNAAAGGTASPAGPPISAG